MLPQIERIRSTAPVSSAEAFDIMSHFLAAEKQKQLSLDFNGESFLTSSPQTWNDLRMACNSLLQPGMDREPVAEWVPEVEEEEMSESRSPIPPREEKVDKKSAKKEKKEAKKAKKAAKKAKKDAKKAKKEARKRKRESLGDV